MSEKKKFPIDKYYLDFDIKVLIVLGLWNPYKDSRKYWLYNFYTITVLCLVLAIRMIGAFNNILRARSDLVGLIRPLVDSMAFTTLLMKCINIVNRHSDITIIMDELNWERRMLCSRKIAQYRNETVMSTIKYSEILFRISLGATLGFTSALFSSCINGTNTTIDDLPISATPLKTLLRPMNFWITFIIDYATYIFFCAIFVCHDIFILNIMAHIATQLDILNFRLIHCCKADVDDMSCQQFDENEINFECFQTNSIEKIEPNQELITCILHYNHIYCMVKILKKTLRLILLPQLMSSLLWVSVLGFYLFVATASTLQELNTALYFAMDFILSIIQIMIWCWIGHRIMINSNRVHSAAYEANWYNRDIKFQKNLMILQSLTINPIIISAVGLFDLSFTTFKNILVKAYSTITLMRRFYE